MKLPRHILKVLVLVFCYATAVFTLWPLVPLYLDSLGAKPGTVGLILAMRSLLPAVFSLWAGRIIGRFPLGGVLSAAMGMVVAGCLALALTDSVIVMALGEMVAGTSVMLVAVGNQSYISQTSAPGDAPRNFSFQVGAFSLANVIGPVLGGTLAPILGFRGTFLAIAAFAFVCCLAARKVVREKLPQPGGGTVTMARVKGILSSPRYRLSLLLVGASVSLLSLSITFYPIHLGRLGFSTQAVGILLTFRGLGQILPALIMGRVERWVGRLRLLFSVLTAGALVMIATPFLSSFLSLLLASVIMGMCFAVLIPMSLVLATEGSPPEDSMLALGLRFSFHRAAGTLGPVVYGLGTQIVGPTTPFFIVAAIMATATIGVATRHHLLRVPLPHY